MRKFFPILFSIITFRINATAQNPTCTGYENIKDSVGKPFVKEAYFLREIGIKQNDKDIGLPYDRLLQYPYLIPFKDSILLFNNYDGGLFTFIANTSFEDTLKQYHVDFKNAFMLNEKFNLIHANDTLRQSIRFKRKGNYRKVKKLFFEYELYKLKINVMYIGKYCRKKPYANIGKNKPLFIDEGLDVYVILDVLE